MRSTVSYRTVTGNAERVRLREHVAPVQVTDPPEHCVQNTTERFAASGFIVLDAHGEFLAWAECILVAKRRCDGDPVAERVERCSDGARMTLPPWGKFKRKGTP